MTSISGQREYYVYDTSGHDSNATHYGVDTLAFIRCIDGFYTTGELSRTTNPPSRRWKARPDRETLPSPLPRGAASTATI